MLRSWLGSALFGAVPDFIALQSHDFAIACDIARWHRTIIDSSNCSCDFSFQDGHYPAPEICRADIASGSLLLQTLQHRTLHAGRTTLRWQRCTGLSNEPTRFGMLSSWLSVSAANYMADLCHWLIWIVCRCFGFTILLPRITVGAFIAMFRVYSHCCWIHSQSQCFSHGRVGCILHQC